MSSMRTDFRYAREQLHQLNERQRVVLDLLAQGLTNGQIAEQLGMTLDGAKWNVSEILGKLGFESREQAAEFWRREHPGVLSPRRVFRGIPMWLRITGGAAAAAFVGIALLVILGGDDREPGDLPESRTASEIAGEGVWLAYATENWSVYQSTLRVVNLETQEQGELNEAGHLAIEFSPDATRLAALTQDSGNGRGTFQQKLLIWSVTDWTLIADVDIPPAGPGSLTASGLAWSPDSTRIALFGDGIDIYDSEGALVASVRGTPNTEGYVTAYGMEFSEQPWSPDSQHVAQISSGRLLVADRDGAGQEADLPEVDNGGDPFTPADLVDWVAPHKLRAVVGPSGPSVFVYTATLGSNGLDWDAGKLTPVEEIISVDYSRAAEFEPLVTGSVYGGTSPLSDGSSEVSVLQSEIVLGEGLRAVSLVVTRGGDRSVVHLGEQQPRGIYSTFDLAITAKASGVLTGEVDLSDHGLKAPIARTPQPRRPTPDPAAPPSGSPPARPPYPTYSEPDPNVAVIPYPTPLGERVQPQLTDIPLFPGAEEIDGFNFTDHRGVDMAVQHFEVEATPDEVMDFYWRELWPVGYMPQARAYNEAGEQWNFIRGKDEVHIRTEYLPRDPNYGRSGGQQPGFRGGNARFLEGADGKTWFYVITYKSK